MIQDNRTIQKTTPTNNETSTRKGQIPNVNGRIVFKDNLLCAQFLRDYSGIDILKNVKPEDIIDETKKYQAYLGIEFESDTVKKINLHQKEYKNIPIYLISLIEHKSKVDYNVSMQLLRYMVCIWDDYGKEMKKSGDRSPSDKGFFYPPILPIVYYEGKSEWTASLYLKNRIFMNEIFGEYIPDFTYKLVQNRDYSNDELLLSEDEISLFMMINKIQTPEDLSEFLKLEKERLNSLLKNAPAHVITILSTVLWNLCMRINVPQEETIQYVEMLGGRHMGYLFEDMEKMDIQAERRNTAEARAWAEAEKKRAEEAEALLITCLKSIHLDRERILSILIDERKIDTERAEKMIDKYWNN